MKALSNRVQIAEYMNTRPVIRINMETPVDGTTDYYKGDLVKVMTPSASHPDLFVVGYINCYQNNFCVSSGGSFISNNFGYSDVIERVKWAQAPVVNKDDEVVIIMDFPESKQCIVKVMKVKSVNSQSQDACIFEEID